MQESPRNRQFFAHRPVVRRRAEKNHVAAQIVSPRQTLPALTTGESRLDGEQTVAGVVDPPARFVSNDHRRFERMRSDPALRIAVQVRSAYPHRGDAQHDPVFRKPD